MSSLKLLTERFNLNLQAIQRRKKVSVFERRLLRRCASKFKTSHKWLVHLAAASIHLLFLVWQFREWRHKKKCNYLPIHSLTSLLGGVLPSKGYKPITFRSLSGFVHYYFSWGGGRMLTMIRKETSLLRLNAGSSCTFNDLSKF